MFVETLNTRRGKPTNRSDFFADWSEDRFPRTDDADECRYTSADDFTAMEDALYGRLTMDISAI